MNLAEIAMARVRNHLFESAGDPVEIALHLGAMQAQNYEGGLWSLGVRSGRTRREIEGALASGSIVRTWPMRGTLHIVAGQNVRWITELCAKRPIKSHSTYMLRNNISATDINRARIAMVDALETGDKTRAELYKALEERGVSTKAPRGYLFLTLFSMECLIVQRENQTFTLFDTWLPNTEGKPRDESLYLLARTFFTSHGPATISDFANWASLAMSDAREGLRAVESELTKTTLDSIDYFYTSNTPASNHVMLLPGFDEYILGYKNRRALIDDADLPKLIAGPGTFRPTLLINGRIVGTWKVSKGTVEVLPLTVRATEKATLMRAYGDEIEQRVTEYQKYLSLDKPLKVVIL